MRALRKEEEKPTEADVLSCLRKLGHEVETLAVFDDVKVVFERIDAFKPDVVFNLCETFFSDRAHEPNIPALLELMKVPYTGAGPDALMLCKDKALAKKLLVLPQGARRSLRGLVARAPAASACASSPTRRS